MRTANSEVPVRPTKSKVVGADSTISLNKLLHNHLFLTSLQVILGSTKRVSVAFGVVRSMSFEVKLNRGLALVPGQGF